jgi:hypothetical protein
MTLPPDAYDYVRVSYQSGQVDRMDSTLVQISSDDSDEALVEVPVRVLVGSMSGIAGTDDDARPLATLRNYPNPFSGETTFSFHLARKAVVDLEIYNVQGRLVTAILRDRSLAEGPHRFTYDGGALPSGVYFCRLKTAEQVFTRRMLLLKR